MNAWLRIRRIGDRLVAAVLLAATWPVVLYLMVRVRAHDGGPALIRVTRVGRHGRPIEMWKIRSMRADTQRGTASGLSLTREGDERITPIGRRMRAYHLDEIPQLWNVLRGEMCLLGARPEAPEFVHLDDPRWQRVLESPPGVAGPTQMIVGEWERSFISDDHDGRAYQDTVLPVKLAIDQWYLRTASPRTDALVLVSLIRRFLPGTGSYSLKRTVRAAVPEAGLVLDRPAANRPADHARASA